MTPAVEVIDLSHQYQGRGGLVNALEQVNLSVGHGEFVCLVGASGSGKTSLLRMLAGFLRPTQGQVRVDGKAVHAPSRECGMIFQQPTLFPWLSVRGNVELGLRFQGLKERQSIVNQHLDLVGLREFANHAPYQLSGGMQQRVAIARTLAANPKIVLMDEPFAALDAMTRERLQNELKAIWLQTKKTIILVTHSIEEAIYLGNRVIVLSPRPGKIVYQEEFDFSATPELRFSPEFNQARVRLAQAIAH